MTAFHSPDTLQHALEILDREPVTITAGCTDLFPATDRQELPGPVLNIMAIKDLRGVTQTDAGWRIGATTMWARLARTPMPTGCDMLHQAARQVGSVQIQNGSTVGGNLCNASPAADGVPPLLALDAQVELSSVAGVRQVPLASFISGVRRTELAANEMLTAVIIPDHATRGRSAFSKLGARSSLVISIAMVAARLDVVDGVIQEAAISVGACSPVAWRLTDLEQHLVGQPCDAPDIPAQMIRNALDPIDDVRGDAGYRLEAADTMVRRLVHQLGGAS